MRSSLLPALAMIAAAPAAAADTLIGFTDTYTGASYTGAFLGDTSAN